jgi:hypothetical protein
VPKLPVQLIGPSATTIALEDGTTRLYVTGAMKEEDGTYRSLIYTILKDSESKYKGW